MENKICTKCSAQKDIKDFYIRDKACKECRKKKNTLNKHEYYKNEGYIYIVINKAWADYIKIGRAKNINERLLAYQTASPLRDYELYYNKYVNNTGIIERYFKDNYNCEYEWIKLDKDIAITEIERLTQF